ncbi:MAG: electron transfer flavoprotein subunit beta/FixA family protein [Syntrophobacterales bacterium]|nr:electron transfer flavoprotein subunit beta/FixA family protein [Syntrophobacterales bacterium]
MLHIIVCIKMVPDTTQVKIDPVTNTLVRDGIPFITNPFDTPAIEEALKIKDKHGAKVTILSMGPPTADAVIRKAIAMGADEGILVSDRVFGGADTLATSKVLAHAISELSKTHTVDLVLCGRQTIDGDTAQVGPGIATRLGFSQITLVDKVISVDTVGKKIVVRRKTDEWHEIVETKWPALITVEREANTPRYPSTPRRLYAEDVDIPVWNNYFFRMDPETIGLKGSPTYVKRIFAPEARKGEIFTGNEENPQGMANVIMKKLAEWKVINVDQR